MMPSKNLHRAANQIDGQGGKSLADVRIAVGFGNEVQSLAVQHGSSATRTNCFNFLLCKRVKSFVFTAGAAQPPNRAVYSWSFADKAEAFSCFAEAGKMF